MKVLMLGPHPYSASRIGGGVEAVTYYLAQALQEFEDIDLEVLTINHTSASRKDRFGNVTAHYIPKPQKPHGLLNDRVTAWELSKTIRKLGPDIVHAHVAGLYARAAWMSGLPWLLTPHGIRHMETKLRPGIRSRSYQYWMVRREETQALRKATHVISISPFVRDSLGKYIRGRIYDIDNPVPDQFFTVPNQSELGRVLVVGKLIYRKGIHILLDALPAVLKSQPHVKVRFAGSTAAGKEPQAYWARVQQKVSVLGLTNAVDFLGELDEPELLEEYAKSSLIVSSSTLETAAMAILQAMAVGRPVVATSVGGNPWLVEDGQNGLLVPPNNPPALADALSQIVGDERTLLRMGKQGKEVAESRFRAHQVADQTRRVYHSVIFGRTRS